MKCEHARAQLTAYLDGELEGDRGSSVRGHLRGCAECRRIASDEAALRDGLRALPPVDPPASLWAGVQRQLAAAEVADAERPAWRRAIARWLPLAPRFGIAALAVAAAVGVLAWRATRHSAEAPAPPIAEVRHPDEATPSPPSSSTCTMKRDDVTDELAAEPACITQSYAAAAAELAKDAAQARAGWTADRKQTFDARVAVLRAKIDAASDEHARQAGYRALIRYLQRAAVRDEVAAL